MASSGFVLVACLMAVATVRADPTSALLEFKTWLDSSNKITWDTNRSYCEWDGISCGDDKVTVDKM